ncbi:MAG: aminoacyl-tRNA hydrolase [Bacteroidales bacterium]|nr:aminoacyl-tRNA hydrolase [Bacteroidales bacterium]
MKYLIVGLGNVGKEYELTRHNIGFRVLDALANASNTIFELDRYAFKTTIKYKGKSLILIKPSTYMNLSGKAVKYWSNKENISTQNIFVVVDDIALPFGTIRIRAGGSNGGHNGLSNIDEILESNHYPRLRFGIGNNFPKGKQADYVLSPFLPEEEKVLPFYIETMKNAILSFVSNGIQHCMNEYNRYIFPPEDK